MGKGGGDPPGAENGAHTSDPRRPHNAAEEEAARDYAGASRPVLPTDGRARRRSLPA